MGAKAKVKVEGAVKVRAETMRARSWRLGEPSAECRRLLLVELRWPRSCESKGNVRGEHPDGFFVYMRVSHKNHLGKHYLYPSVGTGSRSWLRAAPDESACW